MIKMRAEEEVPISWFATEVSVVNVLVEETSWKELTWEQALKGNNKKPQIFVEGEDYWGGFFSPFFNHSFLVPHFKEFLSHHFLSLQLLHSFVLCH